MYLIQDKSINSSLEIVSSERDHGVIIDSQLNFGNHIENIIGNSNRIGGNFRDLVCNVIEGYGNK